jgi:hypothetical protein
MGKTFSHIDEPLAEWIEAQHLFFVATAPLSGDGFVNCSPKGLDTFSILDSHTVAYLDLTGSGVETIAHLKENGRIVLMFCSFSQTAKILRLHGRGTAIEQGHPDFATLKARFPDYPGVRAVIRVEVTRIADSCGYGVPRYEFLGQRDTLIKWAEHHGEAKLNDLRAEHNAASLDGLPGVAND